MFIPPVCFDPNFSGKGQSIMAVIKASHWPITLRWDQTLFLEDCNRLDIINCTPGGWFDVCAGDPLLIQMHLTEEAVYSDTDFQYVNETDTLSALFFRFFNAFDTGISEEKNDKQIISYPNPTSGIVIMDYLLQMDHKVQISDPSGRSIPFSYSDHEIDLSHLTDGLYILSIQLPTGRIFSKQIIKRSN